MKALMVNLFLFAIGLSIAFNGAAQKLESKVNLEEFAEEVVVPDLLARLNQVRKEKSLSALTRDKVLDEAARDQAQYNHKMNAVGQEQSSSKKSTAFDRAKLYGGYFQMVEEYDLAFSVQVKTVIKSGRHKKDPSSYADVSEHIVSEWLDERKLDELLFDPNFYRIGFGFSGDPENAVLFVSVTLGSEPYVPYESFTYHKKSYKISPYDRNSCKSFLRDFQYLPELFSDNLLIKKEGIFFYYHDVSLMESILQTNKDMLAIDILQNEQFSCDHGNALHPSSVYDGMMTKPIKKGKLMKLNSLKEQKEFLVKLADMPDGLDSNDVTLSLLVIKDKCACEKISYNYLDGENIRLLDVNLVVDTISIAESIDSNARFLEFTIPFEKNKSQYMVEDIKAFLDSIQLNRFNIKEIDIKAFSSIEGNPVSNEELAKKRAESILNAIKEYQLQEVQTKIETEENWAGFMESIRSSQYAGDYMGKDHNQIRAIVNSDTLKYDLEPFLADQRKAEIKIFVESIFIDSLNPENLPKKFSKSIEEKDFIRAKALQTLLYRAVKNGELDKDVLFEDDIPQYKEYLPLINNRLAFLVEFNQGRPSDSLIGALNMEFEALLGIDPAYGHAKYNKQVIKLYYWSNDLNILVIDEENRINEVKDFYRDIKKLYNTKIDNYFVNRLLMNFNIIAADYYYEKQDFRNRNRALKQVRKYVKMARLDMNQTYVMSRYFVFQMQIDWAVQIMLPFIKKKDYDEAFYKLFLSISVYDEKHVKPEKRQIYFEEMATEFPDAFCKMFSKPGMSVDYLSDIRLKSLYCNSCN